MPDDAFSPSPPPVSSSQESAEEVAPVFPTVQEMGDLLPQFEFHRILGIGGMGAVFLARQIALDRWVAIKLLPISAAQNPEDAERFIKEARSMARLVHPHIVAVFDFGQTVAGHLYLVMEYVEGCDLHRRTRNGQVTPELALEVVRQLCDALQSAHDRGVAHRDIKPANILVTDSWQVKVADFGLARELAAVPNADEPEYGTPDYTAPERMVIGAVVDHRADIYSLGVVMHEMLTGKTPRSAGDDTGKGLPPGFASVISKCLMQDPDQRYQRAAEVKQALVSSIAEAKRAAAAAPAPAFAPVTPISRQPSPVLSAPIRRSLASLGWAFACCVVVVAFAGLMLRNHLVVEVVPAASPNAEPPEVATLPDEPPSQPAPAPVPTPASEPTLALPNPAPGPAPMQAPAEPAVVIVPPPAPLPEAPVQTMVLPKAPEQPTDTSPPATPAPANAPASGPFIVESGPPGEIARLKGHTGAVLSLVLLPDQRRVVSGSLDGTVRVWDLGTQKELVQIDSGIGGVSRIALSPDKKQLVCCSAVTDQIAVMDLESGEVTAKTSVPNDKLSNVAFTPSGKWIVIACGLETEGLLLWNPATAEPPRAVRDWIGWPYDFVTLSDQATENKMLVTGNRAVSADSKTRKPIAMVLDVNSGTVTPFPGAWSTYVTRMSLNEAGTKMCGVGGGLYLFNWPSLLRLPQTTQPGTSNSRVTNGRLIDNDRTVVSTWSDRTLRILDAETLRERQTMSSAQRLTDLVVSLDEHWAVSGTTNQSTPQAGDFDLIVWRLPELNSAVENRMAKATEELSNLPSLDPELAAVREELAGTVKIPSEEDYKASLADLNSKYVAALRRGAVRAAPVEQNAMMSEADLIAAGNTLPAVSADASLPVKLAQLRGIYRSQLGQLKAQFETAKVEAFLKVQQRLMPLKLRRESSGDAPGATRVSALIELLRKGSVPTPDSASNPANSPSSSAVS